MADLVGFDRLGTRQIRARRGGAARHGDLLADLERLYRFGLAGPAQSAVYRGEDGQFLQRDRGRDPAPLQHRPGARLSRVVLDSGVRIPEGLVVGEDPELDARRFRRTESGVCLITQRMLEQLAAKG